MAQAEAGIVTSRCGGEDIGGFMGEGNSGVAGDEWYTASASASTLSASQPCEYVTASPSEQEVRPLIKTSREQGWSELRDGAQHGAAAAPRGDDELLWEELKKRNPRVFEDINESRLELGRVIAEGGQATIYEAKFRFNCEVDMVAKVLKMEGFSLADLQHQWPRTTKRPSSKCFRFFSFRRRFVFDQFLERCNYVHWGTFLKDGRFTFLMPRCWGDLRTLINLKLKDNNSQGPPFSNREAGFIMLEIAEGMKELHERGVLHRGLKAANILISGNPFDKSEGYWCKVADYESSMLVQGTGFWRAPEVLKELLKMPCDQNEKIWTKKVNIYTYAMTCSEVLTGNVPFLEYGKSDWKRIIDGERPYWPSHVDLKLQKLVGRCWHVEPSKRPSFKVMKVELTFKGPALYFGYRAGYRYDNLLYYAFKFILD